ncbi:MAG: hypothetical protein EXQ48_08960 [Acidobacteria bacterium]|nr:hypothetical protein [Acidobacteriota bacterium]
MPARAAESQLESYRKLGYHAALATFEPASAVTPVTASAPFVAENYFQTLYDIWYPPTPAMQQHRAAHSARYDRLIHELRTEARVAGLLDLLAPGPTPPPPPRKWLTADRPADQREFALGFASELFEFIASVYEDLGLVHQANLRHPRAQGWVRIFHHWLEVDVVRDAWLRRYQASYSKRFQSFVKTNIL